MSRRVTRLALCALPALTAASIVGCLGPPASPSGDAGDDAPIDAPSASDAGPFRCTTPDRDGDGSDSIECGGLDCDDDDARRRPGAPEVCDPADVDEDCDTLTYGPRDADGDGAIDADCCNVDSAGARHCGIDCDDARRTVNPDSPEVCNDLDDDCDGATDELVQTRYFRDDDVDGHGTASDFVDTCAPMAEYRSTVDDDCDDGDAAVHPGASERCNAIDDDCSSGGGPEATEDLDADGHTATGFMGCETGFARDDCDDTRAAVHAGADFQEEPWCPGTACLEAGAWECGPRLPGSRSCGPLVVPRASPSFDFDCVPGVEVIGQGQACFSDCLFLLCPATAARPVAAHGAMQCGLDVEYFECTGDCACGTVSLGMRPLGCR